MKRKFGCLFHSENNITWSSATTTLIGPVLCLHIKMVQKRPQMCYFFGPKCAIVDKDVTFLRCHVMRFCQKKIVTSFANIRFSNRKFTTWLIGKKKVFYHSRPPLDNKFNCMLSKFLSFKGNISKMMKCISSTIWNSCTEWHLLFSPGYEQVLIGTILHPRLPIWQSPIPFPPFLLWHCTSAYFPVTHQYSVLPLYCASSFSNCCTWPSFL